MASSNSAGEPGPSDLVLTGYSEVRNCCRTISALLETTKKPGARDLSDELNRLVTTVDSPDRALGLWPATDAIVERLQTVEAAVRYWTDKGFGARLQRAWDRLWKKRTPQALNYCSTYIEEILALNADTNAGETTVPPERPTALEEAPTAARSTTPLRDALETETKDIILGGFKAILKGAAGVADVIPDPVGKIVKMIAETGIKVMDVLDDVSDNRDSARKLGAHIRSLVQAIVQFLPQWDKMSTQGIEDIGLVNMLNQFLSTLTAVLTSLDALRLQERFKQVALHEQNKSEIESFGKDIERAFQLLQARLQLRTLHLLCGAETANLEDRRQKLLDRLGGSNNGVQEKGSSSSELVCLPGTRTSVLSVIETWMSSPSSEPVLWLNGVAGCGKSTIASTVAHRQSELGGTTAIFYCTAGDQAHCSTIIRSLAFWLARSSRGSLEKPILEAIKNEPNVANLTMADQAQLLLSEPLGILAPGTPPAVLVIDGLDEWYEVNKVITLIALLGTLATSANVKILVSSRDEQHIRMAFTRSPRPVRFLALDDDVEVATANGDIRTYLEYHMKRLHQVFRLDPQWPGDTRMESLVRKSEGLFQFAATILRFLRSGYPPAILNSILDSEDSSSRLDDLYLTVFGGSLGQSLDCSTYPLLKHVLRCLICAPGPISLEIIAYLWSDFAAYTSEYDNIRHSILNHLGSFVVVPPNPEAPIRFLHTSIVDFLTDNTRCTDNRFFVDTAEGHSYLAALCLRRLHRDLRQNICGLEDYMCAVDQGNQNDQDDAEGYDVSGEGPETGNEAERAHAAEATTECNGGGTVPLNVTSESGPPLSKYKASRRVTPERVAAAICPGLRYASFYWMTHIDAGQSSPATDLLSLICEFASVHILHWIEVLSFHHSVLSVGHPAARQAADWCSRVPNANLSESTSLFGDTARFLALFADGISSRPLILYECVISLIPTESMLHKTYGPHQNLRVRVIRGPTQKGWPANLWTTSHHGRVNCISISPNGTTVASDADGGRIRLYDVASGMPRGEPLGVHWDRVESLAFARGGKLLVSSSDHGSICIWEVETGQARGGQLWGHASTVWSVAISPDDTTIASGGHDGTVRFWELESGREIDKPLEVGAGRVNSVAFTPDGSSIVCGCWDGSIRRWSVKTRKAVGEPMVGHTQPVVSVCVSPDGKMIASGARERSIRLWNADTGKEIGVPLVGHRGAVNSVAFSPDSRAILSGSRDRTIRLWDTRTGKQMGKPLAGHAAPVNAVAFSPDGTTVVSASSDGAVRAWDVNGVEDEGEVEGHSKYVTSVAFTPDGRVLASRSLDRSIMLWSTETASLLGKVESGYSYGLGRLKFSADGTVLRDEWQDGVAREWDVSGAVEGTGAEIRQVEPDKSLEFPDLAVEGLKIDDEGWIKRGGKKWLWVPQAYGWDANCYLLGTKLVLKTGPAPILDVAGLL